MRPTLRAAAAALAMACGDPSGVDTVAPDERVQLRLVSPARLTGEAGAGLDSQIVVALSGENGRPLRGLPLVVTVDSGGGTVTVPNTDRDGRARVTWTLGTRADTQQITIWYENKAWLKAGLRARAGATTLLVGDTAANLFINDSLNAVPLFTTADRFGNPTSATISSAVVTVDSGDAARMGPNNVVIGVRAGTARMRIVAGAASGSVPVRVLPYSAVRTQPPRTDAPPGLDIAGTSAGLVWSATPSSAREFWRFDGTNWVQVGTAPGYGFGVSNTGVIWVAESRSDGVYLTSITPPGMIVQHSLPVSATQSVTSLLGAAGDTVLLRIRDTVWKRTASGGWSYFATASPGQWLLASGSSLYEILFNASSSSPPTLSARRFFAGNWETFPAVALPVTPGISWFASIFRPDAPEGAFFSSRQIPGPCGCIGQRFVARVTPAGVRHLRTYPRYFTSETEPQRLAAIWPVPLANQNFALTGPGRVEIERSGVVEVIAMPGTRTVLTATSDPSGRLSLYVRELGRDFILTFQP